MEEIEKMCFWEKMHFCENGNFSRKTVEISLDLAKIYIFFIFISSFHGPYYFSDFQHHWHSFRQIMSQKVQKSAYFGPQIS